jgi:uncharacterized membrane protein
MGTCDGSTFASWDDRKMAVDRQPSRASTPADRSPAAVGRGPWLLAAAGIVVVAGTVSLLAIFNDLWLDEIWSLDKARHLTSPWAAVTELHHDNNHILNTLVMYLWPNASPEWLYRLPAWLSGVAAVVLAGLIGRRQAGSPLGGLIAMVLMGGSYLMVHYASEARGYAMAIAVGLLAFHAKGT